MCVCAGECVCACKKYSKALNLSASFRVKGCEEAKGELDGWGLELDNDIMTVTGRTLPAENILFGRGYKSSAGPTAEWARDATTKCVLKAVNITVSELR